MEILLLALFQAGGQWEDKIGTDLKDLKDIVQDSYGLL